MAISLTAKTIDALEPRADRYVVRDAKVSGLELRVAADGTKSWTLRYRAAAGQRRLKLGDYSRLSLAKARDAANRELRKIDAGVDPQAERAAAKRAIEQAQKDSIETLCATFIERHAKVKNRSWRDTQTTLTHEVLSVWKGRSVSSITRRDCRALVQAIADRPAPTYANRVVALLSRLFRFAVDEEIIEANPATQLPKPGVEYASRPEGEREPNAYDGDEVRSIWAATEGLDPGPRAIVRLQLLTGQRPSEVSNLAWSEIDGSWWTIPSSRTKNKREHRVPLSASALDLLNAIPRLDDEPRVFAGWRGQRQLAAVTAQVFADVRRRQKPRHALRNTAASGMAANGVSIEDVSRVLNHSYGPKVTGGYISHSFDREKRAALLKWERRLKGILESKSDDTKVEAKNDNEKVVAFTRGGR